MKCLTINAKGEASQIFDCTDELDKNRFFRTFMSDDVDRLRGIQQKFKISSGPVLTPEIILTMKRLRTENEFGKLREMFKKYLRIEACCSSVMDQILAGL